MNADAAPIAWNDLDRRIWIEELDEFVPHKIFDVHTHLYDWAHYLDPNKTTGGYAKFVGTAWQRATWQLADAVDAVLMPGRSVQRLSFPFPFPEPCDFAAANQFLADQLQGHAGSAGLLLTHPRMTADDAEALIQKHGFLGFKPYRNYSVTGDIQNCRIGDFMPEHLIAVADRLGLIVMLHVSKRDAIADEENLSDLARYCERYPRCQWILAHCARSYSHWAIERAAPRLRDFSNLWYDVSSVCETDAIAALLENVGSDRVMYGSDDIPVGVLRGKYIAFGYAWAYLAEGNHQLGLQHCDPRMTFTRYEQLRAMRRAARMAGLNRPQIAAFFHDTAAKLIAGVRAASRLP